MPVSMVQFGQKLPVLPFWEIGSRLKTTTEKKRGISVERTKAMKAFSGILLGLIAASLVGGWEKPGAGEGGEADLGRLSSP
jgi:hypothetical protein